MYYLIISRIKSIQSDVPNFGEMFFEAEDYINHELVQYSYRKDMPIIITN